MSPRGILGVLGPLPDIGRALLLVGFQLGGSELGLSEHGGRERTRRRGRADRGNSERTGRYIDRLKGVQVTRYIGHVSDLGVQFAIVLVTRGVQQLHVTALPGTESHLVGIYPQGQVFGDDLQNFDDLESAQLQRDDDGRVHFLAGDAEAPVGRTFTGVVHVPVPLELVHEAFLQLFGEEIHASAW